MRRSTLACLLLAASLTLGANAADAPPAPQPASGEWELREEGWAPLPTAPEAGEVREVRQLLLAGEYKKAAKQVRRWLKSHRENVFEADMRLALGDALIASGDYWDALYELEYIARHFTATPCFAQALDRERFLAEKFITGWKHTWLGMPIIPTREEGVELLVRIQERVPGSPLAEDAGKRLADWYFENQKWTIAAEAYDVFLLAHPGTKYEAEVRRHVIEANLARFESPRFDSTGLLEAKQRLLSLQKDFPTEALAMNADALLTRIDESLAQRDLLNGIWYERRREILSAVVMYRRVLKEFPRTEAASQARHTLALLGYPEIDTRQDAKKAPAPATPATPAKPNP